jgi:hypothetical protein
MNVHRFMIAIAICAGIMAGIMIESPGQAAASPGLGVGAIGSLHSPVVPAQWWPYGHGGYGGYVVPYRYGRPFLYTYPPPAYRPYRFYRYPRFYYYPPLYYFHQ